MKPEAWMPQLCIIPTDCPVIALIRTISKMIGTKEARIKALSWMLTHSYTFLLATHPGDNRNCNPHVITKA
jgi:hypothetical protein